MTDTDTIARLTAELVKALEERYRLACAICGGEDAPGLLDSISVEAMEKIAKDNARSHMQAVDAQMKAERERAAALAGAVEVRPLIWGGDFGKEADDPWGGYCITDCFRWTPEREEWFTWSHSARGDLDRSDEVFATVEEAKTAAQADYRARILAALRPSPDALRAMTAAAYEAAARIPDGFVAAMDAAKGFPGSTNPDRVEDLRVIFATISEDIRALTPADAIAAQTRRDAQMRAEGREEAVQEAISVARQALVDMAHEFRGETQKVSKVAFAAERLVTDRLGSLAAQTEEAANG